MDMNTYLEASRLLDRCTLCDNILEYLADESKPRGILFQKAVKNFFAEFRDELLEFVPGLSAKAEADFAALHCGCRPAEGEDSAENEEEKTE